MGPSWHLPISEMGLDCPLHSDPFQCLNVDPISYNFLIMLAGQSSDAKEVQAVCMITIAKMMQAANAAQIQAHLAQLVPALLESLSGMEVGCRNIVICFGC